MSVTKKIRWTWIIAASAVEIGCSEKPTEPVVELKLCAIVDSTTNTTFGLPPCKPLVVEGHT